MCRYGGARITRLLDLRRRSSTAMHRLQALQCTGFSECHPSPRLHSADTTVVCKHDGRKKHDIVLEQYSSAAINHANNNKTTVQSFAPPASTPLSCFTSMHLSYNTRLRNTLTGLNCQRVPSDKRECCPRVCQASRVVLMGSQRCTLAVLSPASQRVTQATATAVDKPQSARTEMDNAKMQGSNSNHRRRTSNADPHNPSWSAPCARATAGCGAANA